MNSSLHAVIEMEEACMVQAWLSEGGFQEQPSNRPAVLEE